VTQRITDGVDGFWKNKKLSPEEKNKKLQAICRSVFSSAEGKVVLNMLMTDLYLYEQVPSEREDVLNDYAKFFIRERLGIGDTVALTDYIAETAATGGEHNG
jgi:hypothetical protein